MLHAVEETVACRGAQQQPPLVRREQSRGVALQLARRRQEFTHQGGGGDGGPERVEEDPNSSDEVSSPSNHGFVGTESTGGAEGAPRLADETGPQGQAARLVGAGPGDDGGHEVVDPRRGSGSPVRSGRAG